MSDSVESVRSNPPPPEVDQRRIYEEQRRIELEELERSQERPPEEGKGQYLDVVA